MSLEELFTESEKDLVDKLEHKKVIIPGKSGEDEKNYLPEVNNIVFNNLMNSPVQDLNNQLANEQLITLQKRLQL